MDAKIWSLQQRDSDLGPMPTMICNDCRTLGAFVGAAALAILLFASPSLAQQQQAPPVNPPATQQSQPKSKSGDEQSRQTQGQPNGTSNDRLFWTLPNFLTVENASQVPPLTSRQKFKVVARSSFDYVEYPYLGFLAGISQAENSEPGFGQGAAGYGKRFGAAFADNTIENFMVGAIVPSLLHQDPRYYQLGHGGFWHRAGYAVSRMFVTRTDAGNKQINCSEILGSAIAAGISNAYHPSGDRTLSNTMSVWGTQVGWDTVATVVKEFWPDIRRKFQKEK
jgi:hypothetical protein